MRRIIEEKYHGMQLGHYLRTALLFSNTLLKSIKFDGGNILLNEEPKNVRARLATGDMLTVVMPPEKRGLYMQPEDIPLSIVYEDKDLLILDKQPGIASMPNPHTPSGTIANGLIAYYNQLELPYTVHIVTRLDRNTSGLMLVAKHRYIHSLLAKHQHNIFREYRAIIKGCPSVTTNVIDKPIGRKEGSIIERTVIDKGKRAVTYYEVLERYGDFSLVKVILKTGRTHQIRVHLSSIEHPIMGDDLYGGDALMIDRQALHCFKLQFTHPLTKKLMTKESELPEDMKSFLLNNRLS